MVKKVKVEEPDAGGVTQRPGNYVTANLVQEFLQTLAGKLPGDDEGLHALVSRMVDHEPANRPRWDQLYQECMGGFPTFLHPDRGMATPAQVKQEVQARKKTFEFQLLAPGAQESKLFANVNAMVEFPIVGIPTEADLKLVLDAFAKLPPVPAGYTHIEVCGSNFANSWKHFLFFLLLVTGDSQRMESAAAGIGYRL